MPPNGGVTEPGNTLSEKKPVWETGGVSNSGNSLYFARFSYNPRGENVDFGTYIAQLREKMGFSLRELDKRAGDLNHVYIWRLEKGDRDAPSPETLEKLFKALELGPRERELAELLVRTEINDVLFRIARDRVDIAISDIEPVATMSFRGDRPTDEAGWLRRIDAVKDL